MTRCGNISEMRPFHSVAKRDHVSDTHGRRSEDRMNLRGCIIALLMVYSFMPRAIAQSGVGVAANEQYVPRLGDIMSMAQLQHMKLWFAGKSLNWDLAAYELRQLKASLVEAASLYRGIPV